jgi:hypothetical protein
MELARSMVKEGELSLVKIGRRSAVPPLTDSSISAGTRPHRLSAGCRPMSDQTLRGGESERKRGAGFWRAMAPLAGVAACLLLAAVIINPFREMMSIERRLCGLSE